jgi:cytochrome c oxidase assembly protein subunit 15
MSTDSPSKNSSYIIKWLQIGMILVLLMVVIGGITRLTQSGLSMVHWKPLHFLPPLNETQWQEEFAAYQTSPEFQHFNTHFTLSDFKSIYFWEYLHRLIGRIMGLVFFIPFVYFFVTKKIESRRLLGQLLLIFIWGGLQGFLGWYMVKSGLVDNPHVSHYRLALHLFTAFTMISYMYWVVLTLKYPRGNAPREWVTKLPIVFYFLILLQIVYGAFTAGLKAGFVYSTYPLMQHSFFPQDAVQALKTYGWISVFENHAMVQFTHRWLGFIVLGLILGLYIQLKNKAISSHFKFAFRAVVILITLQFILGVLTLLLHVPIVLAVMHQLVAALLLLAVVRVWYWGRMEVR